MSKPSSHIFYNTVGYRKSFNYFKEQIELIIQTSKNKYDFREHPRAKVKSVFVCKFIFQLLYLCLSCF